MSTTAPSETASNSIAVIVAQNPAIVLIDQGKRDDLYAHIKREVEAHVPDLTTVKGRDAIKSLAFKITRTKTAIDAAGKQLNEEARARIGVVDAARRDARETLDRMAAEVRQPLTDWEEAEKAREAKAKEALAIIADMARVEFTDTAQTVQDRIADLTSLSMNPNVFRDGLDAAVAAKDAAIDTLKEAHARLAREEADRAELERLRAEAVERERAEAERRAAEEAERQRVEAERLAEERRAAAEKAEAERIERVRQEAAQAAEREAQRKADAERQAAERAHAEALAAERRRADEAEAARKAEADRIAKAEADRLAAERAAQAEAKRIADEQAARERNRAHRGKIMGEAKQAIMSCGVEEPIAKAIVLAIVAGTVPHTAIQF